jgi:hypothetical protein
MQKFLIFFIIAGKDIGTNTNTTTRFYSKYNNGWGLSTKGQWATKVPAIRCNTTAIPQSSIGGIYAAIRQPVGSKTYFVMVL